MASGEKYQRSRGKGRETQMALLALEILGDLLIETDFRDEYPPL
jgi:hypothetical protein